MASQSPEFRTRQANPDNPGVEDIDPKEVWELKDKLKLIDVRRPDEFEGELGHIPGAELMVLDTLPQRLQELPADRTILFICRSGARSGRAAAFAHQNGLPNAFNMKGGMISWNQLGLEIERP
ncbi:MAG TPA: rhodanese-like domain-containing protein [Bdellovibrionales bacterium]|nr:rhodanese-like domain-containing protein [Bdellovibrionales bacterium]